MKRYKLSNGGSGLTNLSKKDLEKSICEGLKVIYYEEELKVGDEINVVPYGEAHCFVEDDIIARNSLKKTKKKEFVHRVSFRSKLEMFMLRSKLFGFGGLFGVTWKEFFGLFKRKEIRGIYG